MKLTQLSWVLAFLANSLFADDTPFLKYRCQYDRATEDYEFQLVFKDDDSTEVETWSSSYKRTKMRFEKTSRTTVAIYISTGLPMVSHAIPEEFRFTAPLNDEFNFSFGMKPLTIKNEFFSLVCKKAKAE